MKTVNFDEIIDAFLAKSPQFVIVDYDEPHSVKQWEDGGELLKEKIRRGQCSGFLMDEDDQEIRVCSIRKGLDKKGKWNDTCVASAFPKEMVAGVQRLKIVDKPTKYALIFWIDRCIERGHVNEGDDTHIGIAVNAGVILKDESDDYYRIAHDFDTVKMQCDCTTILSRAVVKRIVYYGE